LEAAEEIGDIRGHETATGLKITAGFLYIFWDRPLMSLKNGPIDHDFVWF